MFKKLFSLMLATVIVLFASAAEAKLSDWNSGSATNVSVILDTPAGYFSSPEKVNEMLKQTLDKVFEGSSKFKISSIEDTSAQVQIYRENRGTVPPTATQEGAAVAPVMTPYGGVVAVSPYAVTTTPSLYFNNADMEALGQELSADYLVYVRVTNTAPQITTGVFHTGQKVNVSTDFRVWSVADKKYVYAKHCDTTGSSNTIMAYGMGSSSKAVQDGLKKALKQVEEEASKIRMSMVK